MFTITKTFEFSASHQLLHLPATHKCHRLHGHNYQVILELAAEKLDADGFVVDYGGLSPFKDYLDNSIDHKHLNDLVDFPPTAELLAEHFYKVARALFPGLSIVAVTVKETQKTAARYEL